MNLTELLMKRYSTKVFDPNKKINESKWKEMEQALRLSASSTNTQPWHFFIASSEQGKKRMMKGTEKFPANESKVRDASHVVLFCAKNEMSDQYLQVLLDKEESDGRYKDNESKEKYAVTRNFFVNIHKEQHKDLQSWCEKQVYLNIGNALLSAALLQIDAVPMEGIDVEALCDEFDLNVKGLSAVAMVSFGYRSDDDFNSKLPKSRLDMDKIITHL